MITKIVKKEFKKNPYVLFRFGGIEKKTLKQELKKINFIFPMELIKFWVEFGGGDFFETETLLHHLTINNVLIDELIATNNFHYSQGLNEKYLIFKLNPAEVTTFDKETNEIVMFHCKKNKKTKTRRKIKCCKK